MLEATAYTTGPLNQYTAIERGEEASFEPVYDADGNQTLDVYKRQNSGSS